MGLGTLRGSFTEISDTESEEEWEEDADCWARMRARRCCWVCGWAVLEVSVWGTRAMTVEEDVVDVDNDGCLDEEALASMVSMRDSTSVEATTVGIDFGCCCCCCWRSRSCNAARSLSTSCFGSVRTCSYSSCILEYIFSRWL